MAALDSNAFSLDAFDSNSFLFDAGVVDCFDGDSFSLDAFDSDSFCMGEGGAVTPTTARSPWHRHPRPWELIDRETGAAVDDQEAIEVMLALFAIGLFD